MSRLLVKGGRVVDPSQGIDAVLDVLLADGRVEKLGKHLAARGAEVVDALQVPGRRRGFVYDPFGNRIELIELERG